ncbi:F-box protein AFR [Amborella trichopoda]|uniref:F-box domain-containing protein n=1 Tax=Amborella trichopoda TaxID=13333 RepID=W1PI28_AMBTC|nr:F-box protein AFR [Amborella trichopoda]ERN07271.1 hypothetical protein AMTR_s00019p00203560 [Amborella trichopoda]|eukprot:XP_006845596.1 F-box protein AFR [Amborella trichopoda]
MMFFGPDPASLQLHHPFPSSEPQDPPLMPIQSSGKEILSDPPLKPLQSSIKPKSKQVREAEQEPEPLIPGLPDDIAVSCLLRLPFPHQLNVRSVSSSWNRSISSPSFLKLKKKQSPASPYLFVFAFQISTAKLHWQAFDPRSRLWFLLPPMPCTKPVCPPGFACTSIPQQGTFFVCGGLRSDTESPMDSIFVYRASTNSWSETTPMLTPRSFFAAGEIEGKIYVSGGTGANDALASVESYDPVTGQWARVADMRVGMTRYDAAVFARRMYITEGWEWPFDVPPRGAVYNPESDSWEEMRRGMREGWTGLSVVVEGNLFVISEHKNSRVKVYVPERDVWEYAGGGCVPGEVRRPFTVSAIGDRMYVVSSGLHVAVGTVARGPGGVSVEWEVVAAPPGFAELIPSCSQVLYA